MSSDQSNKWTLQNLGQSERYFLPHDLVAAVFPATADEIDANFVNEIAEVLYLPKAMKNEDRELRIRRAVSIIAEIAPRDSLEQMLALQIVEAYFAGHECLRRAMIEGQFPIAEEKYLKYGAKFLAANSQLIGTLKKYRQDHTKNRTDGSRAELPDRVVNISDKSRSRKAG